MSVVAKYKNKYVLNCVKKKKKKTIVFEKNINNIPCNFIRFSTMHFRVTIFLLSKIYIYLNRKHQGTSIVVFCFCYNFYYCPDMMYKVTVIVTLDSYKTFFNCLCF